MLVEPPQPERHLPRSLCTRVSNILAFAVFMHCLDYLRSSHKGVLAGAHGHSPCKIVLIAYLCQRPHRLLLLCLQWMLVKMCMECIACLLYACNGRSGHKSTRFESAVVHLSELGKIKHLLISALESKEVQNQGITTSALQPLATQM
jgi:hypothetical protein